MSHYAAGTATIETVDNTGTLFETHAETRADERRRREHAVIDAALKNAGVYVTLEQHHQDMRDLVEVVADISMYEGLEKGGKNAPSFRQRFGARADDVAAGARTQHAWAINYTLPRMYRVLELVDAGFDQAIVEHDAKTTMRSQLMSKYGGPGNEKARQAWRASLK